MRILTKIKKTIDEFLFPLFIFGIAGCSAYHTINSQADETVDFSKYRTFAWLPDSGMTAKKDSFRNTAYDNDVIRNNAKNYIALNLSKRGLRVQVDEPDVLMQLVLHNEKKERIVTYAPPYYSPYYFHQNRFFYPYYYPYYDYYTYYGWGCQNEYCDYRSVEKQTYVEGSIVINMYDRKLKKLVWTGSAEGDIYDPSFLQNDVHPAIDRIMKKFPIKSLNNDNDNNNYNTRL